MISRVIEFSARNRLLVLVLTALACVYAAQTLRTVRLDALPDLSDTQVIVYTTWDRSPDLVEDQVTYPIVSGLLGAPGVKAIRGFSDFGFSFVYVVFDDGTDLYWARSRVLEYLNAIQTRLPEGVTPSLGPDATGVGWVFQYALTDPEGRHDIDELRSYQDWTLRYALQAVEGVAEVATVGGFEKQFQITVDPVRLAALQVPLMDVTNAVKASNNEAGGRLLEWSGAEYMVRARGYARTIADFEQIVVRAEAGGVPVLLRDVARVSLGPEMRRGVSDLDGKGDAVGGIVVMRQGENALNVINRVKQRLHELEPGLPAGVKVVTTYDRSDLIRRAIDTLPRAGDPDDHRLAGHPGLPLAPAVGHRAHRHHPGLDPALVHPAGHGGRLHQHHVAGRHRDLDRRAGRRRHRRGGERLQPHPPVAGERLQGQLPRRPARGAEGSGTVGLLLAARDCRGLHSRVHARGPGRAPVQAAGLLQEPGDGPGSGAGRHAGPGAADDVRAHPAVYVPAAVSRPPGHFGADRHLPRRGEAPDQPGHLPRL
jgi:hypothetical protein